MSVGQRSTRQRAAVASAVRETPGFRSAQEFHAIVKSRGADVGLSTVYRTLQAMAQTGEIDSLVNDNGESLYRHCGQRERHHHHLVCRDCGLTIEIDGPAVEQWADAVASSNGFTAVTHTVDVFGCCPSCSRKQEKQQRTAP